MIEIDGTFGEGGGQILRTSLALSALTGKPFRISRIRGRRAKPGLRRQHLTGVEAVRDITRADVDGAALGSTALTFAPGPVAGGHYTFDIQTAGSALLVFQTILPPLLRADGPSTVTVRGGTHNPMSPPYDFVAETFLPAIGRLGFRARVRLVRHGFFPAGGGEIVAQIEPEPTAKPVDFDHTAEPTHLRARVYLARLPDRVWEAERRALEAQPLDLATIERRDVADSRGPGNCVMIAVERGRGDAATRAILTAFGERGRPSKSVVNEVAGYARELIDSGAAVDRFLADQMLIYFAMAGGGTLTAPALTLHAETNMAVIARFLPVRFETKPAGRVLHVRCVG